MDITYASQIEALLHQAGAMMVKESFTEIKDKGDIANLVTDMDVKVQEYLVKELSALLPGSSILAEEGEEHKETDGSMWVIDPIDGTTNYIYGYKHSAISIALVQDHEAVLGAVYDPYLDELFMAEKGHGAYLNNKPIHVSDNSIGSSLIMCGTTPYNKEYAQVTFDIMRRMFMAGKDIRRSGSAVLDLCYLACGRVDGFYEQRLSPWDYAAGALIVLEAGGRIMTFDKKLQYSERIGLIAGNKQNIHDLIEITGRNPEHILAAKQSGKMPQTNPSDKKEETEMEDNLQTAVEKEIPSMELLKAENVAEDTAKRYDATLDSILEDMVQEQKEAN